MKRWAVALIFGLCEAQVREDGPAWEAQARAQQNDGASTAANAFSLQKVSSNLQKLKRDMPTDLADDSELRDPTVEELTAGKPATDAQAKACGCDSAGKPAEPAGALVQTGHRFPAQGRPTRGVGTKLVSLLQRSRVGDVPGACGCEDNEVPDADNTIDGEVIYLNECTLTQHDLEFWGLVRTEYLQGGVMIPETFAYVDSCATCEYNNLKCAAEEIKLEKGYCLCSWRVNGADSVNKLVQCSRCVTDCIGQYLNFDLGTYLQPVQQKGMCIKKKSYFVV